VVVNIKEGAMTKSKTPNKVIISALFFAQNPFIMNSIKSTPREEY
jgi:hypothetical protein